MQTRNTLQKDIILRAVNKLRDHPTADMVYEEVVREYPRISKATVYRNLNQMAKLGQIHKVQIPNSADRYDFNLEKHYHFRCRGCGRVFDMKLTYMEELDDIDVGEPGFRIESHSILFEGLCPQCLKTAAS